jgi:alkanesulfonate monooxygenase SsuD/methylene tetrahydromethanopterin reductase-like flavin-dependent oxidoreductase (luciferase family)
MRFGTYYFLQAPPFIPHPDVVRREIEQMVWTEELGFTALRGMPMLNSLLRGPVDQLARSRDVNVKACEKAGRTGAEIASLLARWGVSRHVYVAPTDAEALAEARDAEMWYQESLRRFLIPERIDRGHPLLQAGFRAMQERFATVSWEQLVAESVAFGSPPHGGRASRRVPSPRGRRDALLDELRRTASGPGAPLHGALRPRGHAALPLTLIWARPSPCRWPS